MRSARKITLLGLVVLVVAMLAVAIASCGDSSTATTTPPSGETTAPTGGGAGDQVVIKGFAFDPATVTVAVGDTVTWTNEDSAGHTVVGDEGEFVSGNLGAGDKFSFTFDTAGTYAYHCGVHPSMKGVVVVE